MQDRVDRLIRQYNLTDDGVVRYIDLVSEVGELGKELLKATDYGTIISRKNETMTEEMGDCLFSIFALCCALDLDAETALNVAINKYQKRFGQKGSIDSGR